MESEAMRKYKAAEIEAQRDTAVRVLKQLLSIQDTIYIVNKPPLTNKIKVCRYYIIEHQGDGKGALLNITELVFKALLQSGCSGYDFMDKPKPGEMHLHSFMDAESLMTYLTDALFPGVSQPFYWKEL